MNSPVYQLLWQPFPVPGNNDYGTYTGLPMRVYESHAPVPGTKNMVWILGVVQRSYEEKKEKDTLQLSAHCSL